MAFNGDNMTPLGGNSRVGAAPMGWSYLSVLDTFADAQGPGYFDTFNQQLLAGQFIYSDLADGKAFLTIKSVDKVLKQVEIDADAIGIGFLRDSSLVLRVNEKSDLPDPIAGVITSPDNTNLDIVENIDLGTDRLVIGSGGSITGVRRSGGGASILSGTTSGPLVTANFSGDYLDIGFNQLGAGRVFEVDGTTGGGGTQLLFTRCAFSGKKFRIVNGFFVSFITTDFKAGSGIVLANELTFLGLSQTSTFEDSADGDDAIVIETGVTLDKLLVDTTAFVKLFASKGIVVQEATAINFMEIINTGFNLFNPGAIGIELENPDDIALGTLNNTTFTPGAIPISSNPVENSTLDFSGGPFSPEGIMILNGNLWITEAPVTRFTEFAGISSTNVNSFIFGVNPVGITNDGVNVIIGDRGTNSITVMVGESNVPAFSFAAPTGFLRDIAFDGQDIWIVADGATPTVFQMEGKTAVVKNSWLLPVGFIPKGIDLDGTVVIVSDAAALIVSLFEMDGTFLYSFPTVFGGAREGIAHQEDQYVIADSNFQLAEVFDHNIPFHQGSKNWKFEDCNIPPSATRVVSRFKSAAGTTVVPSLVDEWTDIEDAGLTLLWGAAAEGYEKLFVNNVKNGTVKNVGVREGVAVVSGSLQLARNVGSNINIEVGIFLNTDVISASIFPLSLDTNNTFTPTLPSFNLRLAQGDELRLRFRNVTNTNAVDFFSGTLSV